jgi:hypothetical protein
VLRHRLESESDDRDARVRASAIVFEEAATAFGGRKSLRKSAHLDFREAPTSGPARRRERFRLFLSRRRIGTSERFESLADMRRRAGDAVKKQH